MNSSLSNKAFIPATSSRLPGEVQGALHIHPAKLSQWVDSCICLRIPLIVTGDSGIVTGDSGIVTGHGAARFEL